MDVSNNRLFRWSKPEWLNNSAVRNAGVYTSGALVSKLPSSPPPSNNTTHSHGSSSPWVSSSSSTPPLSPTAPATAPSCTSSSSTGFPVSAPRSECSLSIRLRSRVFMPIASVIVEVELRGRRGLCCFWGLRCSRVVWQAVWLVFTCIPTLSCYPIICCLGYWGCWSGVEWNGYLMVI